jgi:hypothetical protein
MGLLTRLLANAKWISLGIFICGTGVLAFAVVCNLIFYYAGMWPELASLAFGAAVMLVGFCGFVLFFGAEYLMKSVRN